MLSCSFETDILPLLSKGLTDEDYSEIIEHINSCSVIHNINNIISIIDDKPKSIELIELLLTKQEYINITLSSEIFKSLIISNQSWAIQ